MKIAYFLVAIIIVNPMNKLTFAGNVITWVPPYSIGESKQRLNQDFGEYSMKDGLTHLALQFWVPDGPQVRKVRSYGNISDDDVRWFRDWGREHNIKVLLCIYNAEDGWDWGAAVNSFNYNQDAFIQSSVDEMDRLGLDGIEIDLEGPGEGNDQRQAFVNYVRKTSEAIRPRGKSVTVASFAYIWNAPNSNWWDELMPHLDGITSMGYEEIGRSANSWASYDGQRELTSSPEKLMIGMPGGSDSWQGNSVAEQINWVVQNNDDTRGVGVGIWDATLGAGNWRSSNVWEMLASIANKDDIVNIEENISGYGRSFWISRGPGGSITLNLSVGEAGPVSVDLYNSTGQRLGTLYRGNLPNGRSRVQTSTAAFGGISETTVGFLKLTLEGRSHKFKVLY